MFDHLFGKVLIESCSLWVEIYVITHLILHHILFCFHLQAPATAQSFQQWMLENGRHTVLTLEQTAVRIQFRWCLFKPGYLIMTKTKPTQYSKTDWQVFHFLSLGLICSDLMWQLQITDPETNMKQKPQNKPDHVSNIWYADSTKKMKKSNNIKVMRQGFWRI